MEDVSRKVKDFLTFSCVLCAYSTRFYFDKYVTQKEVVKGREEKRKRDLEKLSRNSDLDE